MTKLFLVVSSVRSFTPYFHQYNLSIVHWNNCDHCKLFYQNNSCICNIQSIDKCDYVGKNAVCYAYNDCSWCKNMVLNVVCPVILLRHNIISYSIANILYHFSPPSHQLFLASTSLTISPSIKFCLNRYTRVFPVSTFFKRILPR